ncbi:NAD-dependent epimerase/dehydratase family protein [Pedobacter psychroterrae]|uniref:NAD-dependent epimerase/dehydratase family protein n=1 Tax=Pedobacter psychroterrae TaxID=2530453 RepID=A0A4R0NUP5_9SPHI|nr:NAD-dependent epimerase/dehydratase family protein [Pedobacter psychroterrae]TCD02744.1 NAD-dependent epimerase/dehydratase family protein [Pedobacter psychroterrae]
MDILLTGAQGFLGSIIRAELKQYKFTSMGRSRINDISGDISKEIFALQKFDMVIHAAGKAHSVPKTPQEHQEFFDVNFNGTANLLQSLHEHPPRLFVLISTVAVYGRDKGHLIDEMHPLAANDAYGQSKIKAEQLVLSWCKEHEVTCTILRLPLIVGPNPPGNLKSMIKGIEKGYYFNIGDGATRRSLVLAEDVARFIPIAASRGGIYNLTDGYHPSFKELSDYIATKYTFSRPKSMPYFIAKLIARLGDLIGPNAPLTSKKLGKLCSELTFDDTRARTLLKWKPQPVLEKFITHNK